MSSRSVPSRSRQRDAAAAADAPTPKRQNTGEPGAPGPVLTQAQANKESLFASFATDLLFFWALEFEGQHAINLGDRRDRPRILRCLVHSPNCKTKGVSLIKLQVKWIQKTGEMNPPGLYKASDEIPAPLPFPPQPPAPPVPAVATPFCQACSAPFVSTHPLGHGSCTNPDCLMLRADLSFDDPINKRQREVADARRAASSSSASGQGAAAAANPLSGSIGLTQQSVSLSSQSSPHSSDLVAIADRRSQQLAALAEVGSPWPIYEQRGQMTAEQAVNIAATSLHNRKFLATSKGLVKYVQSGRMVDPAFAVPASTLSLPRPRERETMSVDGYVTMQAERKLLVQPLVPLSSMRDYSAALVSVILPALEEQPWARQQWLLLTRGAIEIERNTEDWSKAKGYILESLRTKAETAQPFGADDPEISLPILNEATIRAQIAKAAQGFHPQKAPQVQKPPNDTSTKPQRPCLAFQKGAVCRFGALCRSAHVCEGCQSKDHGQGACPIDKRTEFPPDEASGARAPGRGRGRGGRGRGNGRPPAVNA